MFYQATQELLGNRKTLLSLSHATNFASHKYSSGQENRIMIIDFGSDLIK